MAPHSIRIRGLMMPPHDMLNRPERMARTVVALLTVLVLAACGLKGDLYLPSKPATRAPVPGEPAVEQAPATNPGQQSGDEEEKENGDGR